MSTAATAFFDTLSYAKKLEEAGFTRQQAEVQANAIRDIIDERLVTRQHLDVRLAELKHELLKWMIGIAATQIALIVALFAFIK